MLEETTEGSIRCCRQVRRAAAAVPASVLAAVLALAILGAVGCNRTGENNASSGNALSRNDVSFRGMQLRPQGEGSYEAVGRLANNSAKSPLHEVTLTFTMEDVTPQGSAAVVASKTVVIRHEVLPGQSEHVREQVSFGRLPKPRGRYEWNYSITAINGVSVVPPGKEGGR